MFFELRRLMGLNIKPQTSNFQPICLFAYSHICTFAHSPLHPRPVLPDEVNQLCYGHFARHIAFYNLFPFIQRNLSGTAAYIAEVGICHFTGTIYDATHDGDLHTLEVMRHRADACGGFLKVKKCAATTRATYVFRLRYARACGLKDTESCIVDEL